MKQICIFAVFYAVSMQVVIAAETANPLATPDPAVVATEYFIVNASAAAQCPNARYKAAKAKRAIDLLKATGRFDPNAWNGMIAVTQEAIKGGLMRFCSEARRLSPQNPFLSFE